jgi:hypothetical protein
MKTKPNPLTVVILIGVAIGALFLVSDTYLSSTRGSREADKAGEQLDKNLRAIDEATAARKREELRNSGR